MEFEDRCSIQCGNILLSYGVKEDHLADAKGYKFLGAAKDDKGNEVHVFEMQALEKIQGG